MCNIYSEFVYFIGRHVRALFFFLNNVFQLWKYLKGCNLGCWYFHLLNNLHGQKSLGKSILILHGKQYKVFKVFEVAEIVGHWFLITIWNLTPCVVLDKYVHLSVIDFLYFQNWCNNVSVVTEIGHCDTEYDNDAFLY